MEFLLEGIKAITWQQIVMYIVGAILIFLAIKKDLEPALLLPMGFGAILVNLPLSGVIDQKDVPGAIQWLFEVGIEASEIFPFLSMFCNLSKTNLSSLSDKLLSLFLSKKSKSNSKFLFVRFNSS